MTKLTAIELTPQEELTEAIGEIVRGLSTMARLLLPASLYYGSIALVIVWAVWMIVLVLTAPTLPLIGKPVAF